MVAAQRGEQATLSRIGPASAAGRGLDWLNLFVANIQTGFGPFIAVYLTTKGWTGTSIGIALSLGTVTAMASQIPAGALVDAIRQKHAVAALSIVAFTISALLFAAQPSPLGIYVAEVLHGFSSCTLGPAIAAMSLALAGRAALGLRLGRNARYASIGNGMGAALMGACGYYISNSSVFVLTALLAIPALAALRPLTQLDYGALREPDDEEASWVLIRRVLADRRLVIFAGCAMVFTLANAALLPFASTVITKQAPAKATLLIAAGIILPQVIVALLSPSFGNLAQVRGRRLMLLLGFCMLPLRGLLFAVVVNPWLIVAIQALDGIAATSFGIGVPLVTSDIAGRSGHFNLALGVVSFAIGIGATIGTTLAGWIGDHFGDRAAFLSLAAIGLAATALVGIAMPETRPASD
jgi:MFS family permease